jgi:hypothetical protein
MATQTDDPQGTLHDDDDDWEDEPRESIEDKAENGGAEPDGPPPIEGKRQQLSLVAGGEDPDASESKLRGGSVPVEGEFEKGDVLTLLVKVSCDEVHFIDKKDNDGYVVATTRRHIFKPLSIQRA